MNPMQTAKNLRLVLVTAPDLETARKLATVVLEAKLAACVNLVPGLESHYWWQGKLDHSAEVLLLLKTSVRRLPALERLLLQLHPYDTPEIVALPVLTATARYRHWWLASLQ